MNKLECELAKHYKGYIDWAIDWMKEWKERMAKLGLDINYEEFQQWNTERQIQFAKEYFNKVNKPVLEEVEAWARKHGSQ